VPLVVRVQHVLGVTKIIDDILEVSGITASVAEQNSTQAGVFGGAIQQWITAFWATALSTNLVASST
jgi:hypothetical protein